LHEILYPIYELLAKATDKRIVERIRKNVFGALLENLTEEEEQEEEQEEAKEEEQIDLRYWKKHFNVNANLISSKLFDIAKNPATLASTRNICYELMEKFKPFKDPSVDVAVTTITAAVAEVSNNESMEEKEEEEVKPVKAVKNPFSRKKGGKKGKKATFKKTVQ
jgi:hypothetical protein